jgi:hypothetical protein
MLEGGNWCEHHSGVGAHKNVCRCDAGAGKFFFFGAERRKVLGDSDVMSADTVDLVAYCFECGSYGEG